MKTESDFEVFYENNLKSILLELEKRRRKLQGNQLRVVGFGVLFVLFHYLLISVKILPLFTIFISLLATPAACFYVYGKWFTDETIGIDFKQKVIPLIMCFFDPTLKYEPEKFIDYEDFEKSSLFLLQPEQYTGDDLISGSIDGIPIQFSEIKASYRRWLTKKDREKENEVIIFHGVFLVADYPKMLQGNTFIFTNNLQKKLDYLGRLIQNYNFNRGKYIHTQRADFHEQFVVYANNEIEGENILTTPLIDRLIHLRKRTKADISIALQGNKIYVAINTQKEFFSIKTNRYWTDYRYIKSFYDDLSLMLGIIDDLNLDELELPSQKDSIFKTKRPHLFNSVKIDLKDLKNIDWKTKMMDVLGLLKDKK
jgi:hypothetical protein